MKNVVNVGLATLMGDGIPDALSGAIAGTIYFDRIGKKTYTKRPDGQWHSAGRTTRSPESKLTEDLRHARHQISRAQSKLQAMGKGYGSAKKRKMWTRRLQLAKVNFIAIKLRGAQAPDTEFLNKTTAGVQTQAVGIGASGAQHGSGLGQVGNWLLPGPSSSGGTP